MKLDIASIFNEIIIPIPSFFSEQGEINISSTEKYISLLNQSPVRRIILFGTTGEGVSLSLSEKQTLLELYEDKLDDNFEIILCTGSWCIRDIVLLTTGSKRVSRILQLPTSYYDREDNRLVQFFSSLYKMTSCQIYLYHLPKNTLFPFNSDDVIIYRSIGIDIVGIKLSHADIPEISNFKSLENFEILYGSDKDIMTALNYGTSAVVCQNLSAQITSLTVNDDLGKIQSLADDLRSQVSKVGRSKKLSKLKQCLSENSNLEFSSNVRPPYLPYS